MVIPPSRVPDPTVPTKLIFPPVPALRVTGSVTTVVPSSLPLKVMLLPVALPMVVLIVKSPVPEVLFSFTSDAKPTVSAVVVMVRSVLIVTNPVPVCATDPSAVIFPFKVSKPPL